jgi:hypothetical protein
MGIGLLITPRNLHMRMSTIHPNWSYLQSLFLRQSKFSTRNNEMFNTNFQAPVLAQYMYYTDTDILSNFGLWNLLTRNVRSLMPTHPSWFWHRIHQNLPWLEIDELFSQERIKPSPMSLIVQYIDQRSWTFQEYQFYSTGISLQMHLKPPLVKSD